MMDTETNPSRDAVSHVPYNERLLQSDFNYSASVLSFSEDVSVEKENSSDSEEDECGDIPDQPALSQKNDLSYPSQAKLDDVDIKIEPTDLDETIQSQNMSTGVHNIHSATTQVDDDDDDDDDDDENDDAVRLTLSRTESSFTKIPIKFGTSCGETANERQVPLKKRMQYEVMTAETSVESENVQYSHNAPGSTEELVQNDDSNKRAGEQTLNFKRKRKKTNSLAPVTGKGFASSRNSTNGCRSVPAREQDSLNKSVVDATSMKPSVTKEENDAENCSIDTSDDANKLQTVSCQSSGSLFVCSKSGTQENKKKKRKQNPYVCEECGKIFFRGDLLRNHKRVHSGDKPFTCEECGTKFREAGHLKRHMTIHTGKKPFKCDICGKELNSSLAKHLRRHFNDRQFPCNFCDKKFVSGFELKQHIETHNKDEQVSCTVCEKTFSHKKFLKSHMISHSDKRPFACEICEKGFKSKQDRDRHQMSHLQIFSCTCHICGKQFSQERYLKRHINRHKNNMDNSSGTDLAGKLYVCRICDKTFTTSTNLTQHMELHRNHEMYACYICSKMFSQQRYLKRHIKRHLNNPNEANADGSKNEEEPDDIIGQMVVSFNQENADTIDSC